MARSWRGAEPGEHVVQTSRLGGVGGGAAGVGDCPGLCVRGQQPLGVAAHPLPPGLGCPVGGERTSTGGPWQPHSVRQVLVSRHVTEIRVFRGQDFGEGGWPAITDRGVWNEAQDRRAYRASAHPCRRFRFYLLRGLVMCKKCGAAMAGSPRNAAPHLCVPSA